MDIGVEEIREWHLEKGFADVGYHKVIRRNGDIEDGRPENIVGAHARPINSISLGVCLVGGVDDNKKPENNFTPKQFKSLEAILRLWKAKDPDAQIIGHKDVPGVKKACPSFNVKPWAKEKFNA